MLARLQELHLVERRLPATVPPNKRRLSRMGRYHFADPFLHFYFSFIAPQRDEVGYRPERVLASIQEQLRSFVGRTAYEALSRTWVDWAGRTGQLPFEAEQTGSYWSRATQVDVVAVNWSKKQILLGECKWGATQVELKVLKDLIEKKTPLVRRALPDEGEGWTVKYALFGRWGFKADTRSLAEKHRCTLVDLKRLDHDIGRGRAASQSATRRRRRSTACG